MPVDRVGGRALALRVHELDGEQLRRPAGARDADAVVPAAADDAGHVGAVAVVVLARALALDGVAAVGVVDVAVLVVVLAVVRLVRRSCRCCPTRSGWSVSMPVSRIADLGAAGPRVPGLRRVDVVVAGRVDQRVLEGVERVVGRLRGELGGSRARRRRPRGSPGEPLAQGVGGRPERGLTRASRPPRIDLKRRARRPCAADRIWSWRCFDTPESKPTRICPDTAGAAALAAAGQATMASRASGSVRRAGVMSRRRRTPSPRPGAGRRSLPEAAAGAQPQTHSGAERRGAGAARA